LSKALLGLSSASPQVVARNEWDGIKNNRLRLPWSGKIIIIMVREPTDLAKTSEDKRQTQSCEDSLDTQGGNHMRVELEKAVYRAPLGMEIV